MHQCLHRNDEVQHAETVGTTPINIAVIMTAFNKLAVINDSICLFAKAGFKICYLKVFVSFLSYYLKKKSLSVLSKQAIEHHEKGFRIFIVCYFFGSW